MLEKIIKNKKYIKVGSVILAIIVLSFFKIYSYKLDNSLANFANLIHGEQTLDSNIVLIHISPRDIESLGSWPLKRSLYALLIDELSNYKVRKIGLEIFLTDNYSQQNIYNNVLINEIKKAKNVVLSSILNNIRFVDGKFIADSIVYPVPKKKIADLETGHLNFLNRDGIYIPAVVSAGKNSEKAFSLVLAGLSGWKEQSIKVNFYSSWKLFKKYSLLEFFSMINNHNPKLKLLKNKIVIIGVSDPLIATSFSTVFDNELPGIGLHALALDNILTGKNIIIKYKAISTILFFIILIIVPFLTIRKKSYYFHFAIAFLIMAFGLFVFADLELDYMAFLFPLFLLAIVDISIEFTERKSLLSKTISEAEILRSNLKEKENELIQLENELNNAAQSESDLLKLQIEDLNKEIVKLRKEEQDQIAVNIDEDEKSTKNFEGIIYRSKKMASVVDLIKKVAPENATILVLGESGSGKELVAQAIHKLSPRKDNNFVIVNCAALSDTLLESELFGHVKGAFTDAVKDKTGRFEAADKGTIFLDEIGETSENFQVKLLRVLQTGDFQKVGSSETKHTDVRIVAATNKSLTNLVKEKKFREDLYYRLNVINITLPPLRERKEDIEILANHFLKREAPNLVISKAVMNQLTEHRWKGNVRELESIIKRAAIFAKAEGREIVKLRDLPEELAKQDKSNLENLILESLREKEFSHSSINETARELGDLNRTVVSENFRGIFFMYYYENQFDIDKAVKKIAATDESSILEKVNSKAITYLKNIEKDLDKLDMKSFKEVKEAFASKYKNLPQKYHIYLDKVIRKILEN
ncbi:nif-specific regulatory protein [bacterium BMS3Abin04]|nr:nif-specific regulatory protein [bacterium BMS3Abin04]